MGVPILSPKVLHPAPRQHVETEERDSDCRVEGIALSHEASRRKSVGDQWEEADDACEAEEEYRQHLRFAMEQI